MPPRESLKHVLTLARISCCTSTYVRLSNSKLRNSFSDDADFIQRKMGAKKLWSAHVLFVVLYRSLEMCCAFNKAKDRPLQDVNMCTDCGTMFNERI